MTCRPLSAPLAVLALTLAACGDNAGTPDGGATGADAAGPRVGLTLFDYARAVDVSPDGRLAAFERVGADLVSTIVLLDTTTGATTDGGAIGDVTRDFATGLADTGRVSALHGDPVQAGVWSPSGGWLDLPPAHPAGCDADIAAAWDVSADGAVVVGMSWDGCIPRAFRWTDASGTGVRTPLATLGTPSAGAARPVNRATVVSDDGRVAAGFAQDDVRDRVAARWTEDGSGALIEPGASDAPSEVLAIDATGATLAGVVDHDGFVWTAAGITPIARFDAALPTDPVYPNAITGDGRIVFGGVGDAFSGVPIAFTWTADGGMRPLTDALDAAGVALPTGVVLTSVLGASADGRVIVGTALDGDGKARTFALVLPAAPR